MAADGHRGVLRRQRVPRGDVVELGDRADVAGDQPGDGVMVGPSQPDEAVHPDRVAGAGVDQHVVHADGPRQHLEHRDPADVRVGQGLEHEGQRLALRIAGHLAELAGPVDRDRRHLRRGRPDVHDEAGQTVHPDRDRGRPHQDGEHRRPIHAGVQDPLELFERRLLAFEVALEQGIVLFDDVLDQMVVLFVLAVGDVGRQFVDLLAPARVVEPDVFGDQVGHAVEGRLLADGQLDRLDAGRGEPLLDLGQGPVEPGPVPVQLVDEDHARLDRVRPPPATAVRPGSARRPRRRPRTRPGRPLAGPPAHRR